MSITFGSNLWGNLLCEYEQEDLDEHAKTSNPKLINFLKKGDLSNVFSSRHADSSYKILTGDNLAEIDKFSDFTIETYYKKFPQ